MLDKQASTLGNTTGLLRRIQVLVDGIWTDVRSSQCNPDHGPKSEWTWFQPETKRVVCLSNDQVRLVDPDGSFHAPRRWGGRSES